VAGPHEFETHLFISYAHIDNQPLSPDQQGWVSRFHASLEAMLSMRLGRKALIWRDKKRAGNDVFADEIVAQFPKTALLISVLTPRYVESEWCTREVREFCDVASQTGGVIVSNKSRGHASWRWWGRQAAGNRRWSTAGCGPRCIAD
jgi:hypothetical protein